MTNAIIATNEEHKKIMDIINADDPEKLEGLSDVVETQLVIAYQKGRRSTFKTDREQEEYLFKIVAKVLAWADVKNYTQEQVADLVMLNLINVK